MGDTVNEPTLEQLKKDMVVASVKYFEALEKELVPKYSKEIEEKVLDESSIYYKYYFVKPLSIVSGSVKKMYKELLLKVHPDKNNDKNANIAFVKLEHYKSDKHVLVLEYFYKHIDSDDLIATIINYVDKTNSDKKDADKTPEERLVELKGSWWYLYHSDSLFRSLFIPEKFISSALIVVDNEEKV
jgi:hypothetical protein